MQTIGQMTRRARAIATAYAEANPDSPEAAEMLKEYEEIVEALGYDPAQ